ncbi:hypothetical protein [Swingsia samuiensis]|uniref:Uncharacterized protein n=1 Tax=Swingsia samuiensis TaxID=1293412 RepID=A0A4Y6UJX6_9PROT|nr:hypothetical protein [Swingsia samuiensis]QDH16776.1 hypothetical protein E3D00_03735 [Swingsia samuiensis]
MDGKLRDTHNVVLQSTDGKPLFDTGFPLGSIDNFVNRLRGLLPSGWFPAPPKDLEEEQAPILVALLKSFASIFSALWSLMEEAKKQLRLKTMVGAFLDIFALDFFGEDHLPRQAQEKDDDYRIRIIKTLRNKNNTRLAVFNAVQSMTQTNPIIIEPTNAEDCHAFGTLAAPECGGGYGYGCNGLRYGHLDGGQFFIEVVSGQNTNHHVIYDIIERTSAAGVIGWVRVEN